MARIVIPGGGGGAGEIDGIEDVPGLTAALAGKVALDALNLALDRIAALETKTGAANVPNPPTALKQTLVGATDVQLGWTAPSDGGSPITGYIVSKVDANGTVVYTSPLQEATLLTATFANVLNGETLRVRAVNAVGQGPNATVVVNVIPVVEPTPEPTGVPALRQGMPAGANMFSTAAATFNVAKIRTDTYSGSLHPDSAAIVSDLVGQITPNNAGNVSLNTKQYNFHVFVAAPDTPRKSITWVSALGNTKPSWWDTVMSSVPIPSNAVPSAGNDRTLNIYDPATKTLWEIWKTRPKPGLPGSENYYNAPYVDSAGGDYQASWGGRIDDVSVSNGVFQNRNGISTGASATSASYMGLSITVADVLSGSIDHALAIQSINAAKWSDFYWPALRSDGNGVGVLREGQRLRFPPSLNIDALSGVNALGKMVMKAIQKYGCIVTDKAGTVSIVGESGGVNVQADGTSKDQWLNTLLPTYAPNRGSYNALQGIPWSQLEALPAHYGKPGTATDPNLGGATPTPQQANVAGVTGSFDQTTRKVTVNWTAPTTGSVTVTRTDNLGNTGTTSPAGGAAALSYTFSSAIASGATSVTLTVANESGNSMSVTVDTTASASTGGGGGGTTTPTDPGPVPAWSYGNLIKQDMTYVRKDAYVPAGVTRTLIGPDPSVSGSSMTYVSGGGSFAVDTTNYCRGTQSWRITTNGAGTTSLVQRGVTAVNVTRGKTVRILIYVDNYLNLDSVGFWFASNGSSSMTDSVIRTLDNRFFVNGWQTITLNVQEMAAQAGSFDQTKLNYLRINVKDKGTSSSNKPVTVNIGGIWAEDTSPITKGAIAFAFDDGYKAHNEIALPLFNQYGLTATAYVMPGDFGSDPTKMTSAQAVALKTAGWTVGAHAYSGPTHVAMSATALESNINQTKNWLNANVGGSDHFAYWDGLDFWNGDIRDVIASKFKTGRHNKGIQLSMETGRPGTPMKMRAWLTGTETIGWTPGVSPDPAYPGTRTANSPADWINRTIKSNGLSIFVFHNLGSQGLDPNVLEGYLQFAAAAKAAGDLEVLTMEQVSTRLGL